MDDWQDHALSTRHMHNRNSRRGSGKGKKSAAFDVRKTFGEYDVKCASWERALSGLETDRPDDEPGLQLLRLTADGLGVLGELVLPGVLRASVVLAASRKTLTMATRRLSGDEDDEDDEDEEEEEDEEEDEDEEDDDDEAERTRLATFEKNSFRSPKFWLAWNGTLTLPHSSPPPSPGRRNSANPHDSPPPSPTLQRTGSSFPPPRHAATSTRAAEGLGYVIFTGNECRRFKGTLSCGELGWRDVGVSGFKAVARSESDRRVVWGGRDAETGWRDAEGDGERGARLDARRRVVFD